MKQKEIGHMRMQRKKCGQSSCRKESGSRSPRRHDPPVGPRFYRSERLLPASAFTASHFQAV